MQVLRPVVRLVENALHDRVPAIAVDLGHRVVAETVLAHPFEAFRPGPAAAQPDLNEVPAENVAVVDEPAYRLRVRDQVAASRAAGVVVGVEVDDADVLLAVHIGQPGHVGEFDRVITTDDHGDCARLGDLADHAPNGGHAALDAEVVDRRVAVVHGGQFAAPPHHRLHAADATPHRTKRGRPLPGPAEADPHVHGGTHEGHLDLARDEILDGPRNGKAEEAQHRADVDGPGLARRVVRDVAVAPHVEVRVVGVEADDGGVRVGGFLLGSCRVLRGRVAGITRVGFRLSIGLGARRRSLPGIRWRGLTGERKHADQREQANGAEG